MNDKNGMRMARRVRMASIMQCYCSPPLACVCFWECVSPSTSSRHFLSKWNYLWSMALYISCQNEITYGAWLYTEKGLQKILGVLWVGSDF